MTASRARRRPAALLALAAFLFAQATVLAYACPLDVAPTSAAEMPCHETGGTPRPECTAHCQAGAQSVDQPKPLAAPHAVAALLTIVELADPAPPRRAIRAEPVLAHAASPPIPILYRRFLN
jgi:hypothetical protein